MYSRYSNVRPNNEKVLAGKSKDNRFYAADIEILAEVEGENKQIAIYKIVYDSVLEQSKRHVEYIDEKAKNSSIVRQALSDIRKINFIGENDLKDDGNYDGIERNCSTCEFNFGNVCAGKHYGMEIRLAEKLNNKDVEVCDHWGISLNAFETWCENNKNTRLIKLD